MTDEDEPTTEPVLPAPLRPDWLESDLGRCKDFYQGLLLKIKDKTYFGSVCFFVITYIVPVGSLRGALK